MKQVQNIAASHRAKLLALAQRRGDDFQFLLGRWIIERFLYRLSLSNHKKDFVLKGAMLFLAWDGKLYRPTKDLDLLGFGSADIDDVTGRVREICAEPADDGIVFDLSGVEAERIKEDAEYEGVRLRVPASLVARASRCRSTSDSVTRLIPRLRNCLFLSFCLSMRRLCARTRRKP